MPIDLLASLSSSGPIGSEKWFHTKAGNPLHITADGATYLRSGNILVGASATYPDVFAKFKISQATAWAAITAFTANVINFVEYLNGMFWAGGAAGGLFNSPDGLTWTAVTHPMGSVVISDMAYGNGTYVASIGTAGTQTMWSVDGVNWNKSIAYTSGIFNAICFCAGFFVAVGNASRIMRSADGSVWTAITSAMSTSYNYVSIATDGDRKVAMVSSSLGLIYYTDDVTLNAWTQVSNAMTPAQAINDIEYGDGHWVVAQASSYLAVSTDVVNWKTAQVTGTVSNNLTVTYGAGFFVFGDAAGNTFKVTISDVTHLPTIGAKVSGVLVPKMGAYGEGTFILVATTAVAPKISVADSVGIPVESSLAGGDVIKYMRVK